MNSSNFIHVFGKSVVVGLAKSFGLNLPTEYSTWTLNEEEKRWHDRISLMIRCAESGEMVMRDRYELDRHDSEYDDGDLEWDYEEEATVFDEALGFYRSCKRKRNSRGQGVRSLEAMNRRFRWIDSQKVLNAIVLYESTGVMPKNRNVQLEKLALELDEEVDRVINEGLQFTDFELREMALSINRESDYWPNFKCSDSWLLNWKKRFRVSSRRVTEFVSLKKKIWNTDQTGVVKECHGMRTLTRTGLKKVQAKIQSKNATTHSITYLPVIGSDGYQHEKLFVQLGETSGHLPQKGCYQDNRIVLSVAKSHIMSRDTAANFFENVLFHGNVPKKLLLILDSWPVFKDHDFIRSFAPRSVDLHILNIPPGGTSICQPADLSYNHQLKGIQKRLTLMVMFRGIKYRLSERDNLLKFASQVHWILGSPRFKPFISYGFFKGGFIDARPPPFEGPKQFIFGSGSFVPCICSAPGFSLCPRCSVSFCFDCFWVKCHRC